MCYSLNISMNYLNHVSVKKGIVTLRVIGPFIYENLLFYAIWRHSIPMYFLGEQHLRRVLHVKKIYMVL